MLARLLPLSAARKTGPVCGALFTGARRSEIFDWIVSDYANDCLRIRKSKTRAGRRLIPVAKAIQPIIEKYIAGKKEDQFIFAAAKVHRTRKTARPRGDAFGKRFVIYRRAVGVEDQDESRGRSRVNFHSARAWLAEQCELTGAPTNFITRLLGWHVKGAGMVPRYSKIKDQPEFVAKLREIVDSIKLPEKP